MKKKLVGFMLATMVMMACGACVDSCIGTPPPPVVSSQGTGGVETVAPIAEEPDADTSCEFCDPESLVCIDYCK
jgi:hypothetical protein